MNRKRRASVWRSKKLWTIFAASALLVSFLAAIVYYWDERQKESDQQDYVEIYMTDLPADFGRVDVRIDGVYLGDANYSLDVERPAFDLLALHGPAGALRVAAGSVPRENITDVRVVFGDAKVEIGSVWATLLIPDKTLVVSHPYQIGDHAQTAILFDLDLEHSIVAGAHGLEFRPHVKAVYVSNSDGVTPASTQPHSFAGDAPQTPAGQSLAPRAPNPTASNPFSSVIASAPPTTTTKFKWTPGPTVTVTDTFGPPTNETSPSPTDSTSPPISISTSAALPSPGGAQSVPENLSDVGGWFVRFVPGYGDQQAIVDTVQGVGGSVYFVFGAEPAAYIFATPQQAQTLSNLPGVAYVEADENVIMDLASSEPAIRIPDVRNPLLGPHDANGAPIDGRGVGVAIIDTGFDGSHPDLPHHLVSATNPAFVENFKVESIFQQDLITTDQTSGHGTHVASILAGRGNLDPTERGVAPGASLYGFAVGEASTTLWPNVALDWLVQNHDKVDPPIRVVSNSWGSDGSYDPNSLTSQLVNDLVKDGVVVVFAAGNSGGDGSVATTTSQCQIPTAGVICVAAYDDLNVGTRDGPIASYSSRGAVNAPSTWPDISAPGTSIRAARPIFGTETGTGFPDAYTILSGTSMATPHVSGVVALVLQANPNLSPAQVQAILSSTAHKFADGGSYISSSDPLYDGSHYAKGHGLVDAYAAVVAAKST